MDTDSEKKNLPPSPLESPSLKNSSDAPVVPPPTPPQEHFWRETITFAIIALLIVIPFRYFIAQPFVVSGDSMDPTFANGQYLIVDEITYKMTSPERGDVLIFKYPYDQTKDFIKRVIGLPGETVILHNSTVSIKNATGTFALTEPYISKKTNDEMTVVLKPDQYFVMGDNRPESLDSRIWGPLPKNLIIGRPILRLFPVNTLGAFPGAFSKDATAAGTSTATTTR